MKLTKKGEYALRALLRLSANYPQKSLSLREISERERLPVKFLEQIMMVLKRSGLVESTKGKQGGYTLARRPEEITLGEIIRVIEGPIAPFGTALEIEKRIQKKDPHAGLFACLLEVRNAIAEIVDKKTLADICEKSRELCHSENSHPMYYI
ncbi:MAG: Rrf2 family transcriptional regulator [Candidatus Omnitrophica bacterium]|nr:Rrf2 family transcriptional regulator [Candidatus Omnitrophota bacterium]